MNKRGSVPIELDLEKQEVGQIWLVDQSLNPG